MIEVPAGSLFLGETVDTGHQRTGQPVLLKANDLTTHGVMVGMTGSGKTGLGVVLIEEALLQGVPVLIIDPKGDLGNLMLTFPELSPADFAPWVEGGDAAQVAAAWREGLAGWGIDGSRIRAFKDKAAAAIYTPGSTAGSPLNLVGSLIAPADPGDIETMRDEIEGFVSGLLAMIGIQADPLSSRVHILLSNLIEHSWAAGRDLDLAALVGQVQQPPVRKLGVFDVDTFFPPKDRTTFAMRLNGLLASPAFAAWSTGPPLDVAGMLWDGGAPRAAIVSIAHLSDDERQFVVTAVLSKLITWMRRQPGTDQLRVLVYFDEVMGYVPPLGNPPAKQPILTIMKQARAFGVGMVLATQNPVDVDYKGIANAGTWIIGRLQTEQDKARLIDGLAAASGGVDLATTSATISGLAKREFLLRQAGTDKLTVFTTRWAMAYLRGPLTREQIATLMTAAAPAPALDQHAGTAAPPAPSPEPAVDQTSVVPRSAPGLPVRFLAPAAPWGPDIGVDAASTTYAAAAVARVELLFDDERAGVRHAEQWEAVVYPLSASTDPAAAIPVDYDERDFVATAPSGALFVLPEAPIGDKGFFTDIEKAITEHLYRNRTTTVLRNPDLRLYSRVDESDEAFAARCEQAADAAGDEAAAKLRTKYENRLARAQEALGVAEGRLSQATASAEAARNDELVRGAGSVLDVFLGGRRSLRKITTALGGAGSRRGRSGTAKARVDAAADRVSDKRTALEQIEHDLADELLELAATWDERAANIERVEIPLEKSDIRLSALAVVWLPIAAP
ncbi:MAG: helicase HerA-like domain-containing protein [Acidimicrobiales bacterium]